VALTDPMLPTPFRIQTVKRELSDTFTLDLIPAGGGTVFGFAPGQFNMLYAFGAGEVPISISGDPSKGSALTHTIRAVGPVTQTMWQLKRGDTLGVRGPFGTAWPVQEAEGSDVVIIGGGIGLAPLRPAIYHILSHRNKYGNVCIYYGARTSDDILYRRELEKWRGQFDLTVEVTVDRATGNWAGKVGVVTRLITSGGFDPFHTIAMICGPEIMMRYCILALNEQDISDERIYLSMERNMKCGIGFCGHCQFGAHFVCKDGPVLRFDRIKDIFELREL
jgi:NAD(P)H-flavin reductase